MVPSFPNRFIPVLLCSVLFVLGQGGWKRFYMLHFPKNLPRNELTIFFLGGGEVKQIYTLGKKLCLKKLPNNCHLGLGPPFPGDDFIRIKV